jgi:CheY-like chemotaxis protein/anti-sigma regulatory factor (Ser/Thr protein kinase)
VRGLLAPLVGAAVELSVSRSQGGAHVLVDAGQLEQVIVNLVVNARDAVEGKGRIGIETEVAGGEVLLRVHDDGYGMDEATLGQAFEPFFTTKPSGSGTGLGLATVLGIVEQSGGRIDVRSAPGEGTTVEIALPAVGAPDVDAAPAGEPSTDAACHGTVLLAEDEAIVRDLLRAVLVDAGFDVIAAADGEQALALAREAGEIDLLLTDAVMPRMSGRELAEQLVVERPETRVVYMSGYTDDPVLRRVRESGEPFLQKPFSPAELVAALRERLAEPALV